MKKRVAQKIRKRCQAALDAAMVPTTDGGAYIVTPSRVIRVDGRVRDGTYWRAIRRLGV